MLLRLGVFCNWLWMTGTTLSKAGATHGRALGSLGWGLGGDKE